MINRSHITKETVYPIKGLEIEPLPDICVDVEGAGDQIRFDVINTLYRKLYEIEIMRLRLQQAIKLHELENRLMG